jgi:hypothetical protein
LAVPQTAVEGQTGGSGWPTARLAAVAEYTLRLTTILPVVNPENDWANVAAEKALAINPLKTNLDTGFSTFMTILIFQGWRH